MANKQQSIREVSDIGNLGLIGAQRTGKTTLAEALSMRLKIPFVSIGTSAVFKKHGLDPAKSMDFRTRLYIQQQILNHAVHQKVG